MKDDPSELLRRLSIIMLEDAVLHPDLPLVAWLMAAAAKKYAPSLPLVERCLSAVHQARTSRGCLHGACRWPWFDMYAEGEVVGVVGDVTNML